MELSEELKYRLAYLKLRLALDQKLSRADGGAYPGLLAEFGEDVLQLVQRAVAEIV